MLGLTLREEFQGKRLKGTAIELANDNHTGATQITVGEFLEITYPTADVAGAMEAIGPGRAQPVVLIGDAGAVCALIDPEALQVEHLPVRVELSGYARGATIVDRRARGGEDLIHGAPAGWTPMDVALRVDADRLAKVFLEAIRASD